LLLSDRHSRTDSEKYPKILIFSRSYALLLKQKLQLFRWLGYFKGLVVGSRHKLRSFLMIGRVDHVIHQACQVPDDYEQFY